MAQSPEHPRWSPQVKTFVVAVLLVGLAIALYVFRVLIPALAVAALVAYVLRLPVNYLQRRTGAARGLLTLFTFAAFLLLLALAPILFTPRLIGAFKEFQLNLADATDTIQVLAERPITLAPGLTLTPIDALGPLLEGLRSLITPAASGLFTVAGRLASALLWGIFVLVVAFWLVKDYPLMGRYLRSQLPPTYQEELVQLGRELARTWDAFLRGQFTLALVVGTILSVALWILGVPGAIGLGLFSGLMEFIPSLGPLLAWSIAVTLALLQGSSWLPLPNFIFALIVTGLYILVFQLDSVFLIPRIVGHRVRLHPVVVFVGLIAGAMFAGIIGVLLATPTVASLRVVLRYVYYKLLDEPPFPPEEPLLAPGKGWSSPQQAARVRAILFDLDGTLFETDDAVVEVLTQVLRVPARLLDIDGRRLARRIVMALEGMVNGLVTLLDILHLDRPAFWLATRSDLLLHSRPRRAAYRLTTNAHALLADLQARYRLGVVTTRSRHEAQTMLRAGNLQGFFDVVVTRDDVRRLKPHPAPVHHAARALGVPAHQILLVGDTPVDVRAAHAAGALAAAVLSGFGELEELQEADIILEKPAELWRWV